MLRIVFDISGFSHSHLYTMSAAHIVESGNLSLLQAPRVNASSCKAEFIRIAFFCFVLGQGSFLLLHALLHCTTDLLFYDAVSEIFFLFLLPSPRYPSVFFSSFCFLSAAFHALFLPAAKSVISKPKVVYYTIPLFFLLQRIFWRFYVRF